MKNRLPVITILLVAIVVMIIFLKSGKSRKENTPSQNSAADQSSNPSSPQINSRTTSSNLSASGSPASPALQIENLAALAGEVAPQTVTATNIPPTIVLENIRRAVRQYGDMFGGNPVGTNPEITSALNGNNPKQINFISAGAGMQINENGELIDAWGTPLFFHQLSGTEMEIHSAGPDKKMWTRDDFVTK